eukprot:403333921
MDFQQLQFDQVSRFKTFTFLTWCGLPNSLNPRKLSRLGFINTNDNQIKCTHCDIVITLKSHLNFSNDEVQGRRMLMRIKQSHLLDCIFKQQVEGQALKKLLNVPLFSYGQVDTLNSNRFIILDRKVVLLKWTELLSSLYSSFQDSQCLPDIDMSFVRQLQESMGEKQETLLASLKVISSSDQENQAPSDLIQTALIFSLFGWRLVQNSVNNNDFLECCYCLKQVNLNMVQCTAIKTVQIKQDSAENLHKKFNPLDAHYKYCFSNKKSKTSKIESWKMVADCIITKYKLDSSLQTFKAKLNSNDLSQGQQFELHLKQKIGVSKVSEIIRDDIISKIQERKDVQQIVDKNLEQALELFQDQNNEEPVQREISAFEDKEDIKSFIQLGKRTKRSTEELSNISEQEVIRQVNDSLESSRKRLKTIHEKSQKIKEMLDKNKL